MEQEDERLERLLRATEGVSARDDFAARVMGAVEREPGPSLWAELPRAAKFAFPAFAVAAVIAVFLAFRASREVDDASLTTHGAEQAVVSTVYGPELESE